MNLCDVCTSSFVNRWVGRSVIQNFSSDYFLHLLMLEVEVCGFLSTGTRAACRENGLNISPVAYPLVLGAKSCSLASVEQSSSSALWEKVFFL